MELKELLMFMTKKEASDLHLKPMRHARLKLRNLKARPAYQGVIRSRPLRSNPTISRACFNR